MNAKRQRRRRNVEDEPRYVVGMDAHSKKLAISIWDWSDRFNACLHWEIKCVYIKGDVDEFVWTPSDKYAEYRDIMFAYRDTSKEVTRISNHIWSVCSRKGVNYKGAFALEAEEERAKRNGGLHKPLDGEGRQDVKFFFTEAGQSVLTSCGSSKLGKWGWAINNRGKPRNKVACAIGRKLITYGWHIMRGDPTPNHDSEAFFKRKMRTFHQEIGARPVRSSGRARRLP